ncbi:MAG: peptidoglycan-binding domain-containing protein [Mariprofundales bacterium]
MSKYGERTIKSGCRGDDVRELQIRLSGFKGDVPDGIFGSGTAKQVSTFQRDVMQQSNPSGEADVRTMDGLEAFAQQHPIDWTNLRCPCGVCSGFGQGKFKGEYRSGKPENERFYLYEYPGIHRSILWAARAVFFYHSDLSFTFNSGYRCSERKKQTGRKSTNHQGKAIDIDVPRKSGEDKADDAKRCDYLRGRIVELCNAQIGWASHNKKALEPSSIAPTWVHFDVRCFAQKHLSDELFCKSTEELDRPL